MLSYKRIVFLEIFLLIFMLFAGMPGQGASDGMYKDVSDTDWYYSTVKQLYRSGVLPHDEIFNGTEPALRGDIVKYMFNLYSLYQDASKEDGNTVIFEDVGRDSEYFEAVNWAYASGITKGTSSGLFCPEERCSREQVCVMAVRFFDAFGIKPKAAGNTDQFADSLDISGYARSYAVSAKLSGIINGNEKGYFMPAAYITRSEVASILNTMMNILKEASQNDKDDSEKDTALVETKDGAYTYLYDTYLTREGYLYKTYVEKSDAVAVSYFDDAAIVGDSVSLSLQYYNASSSVLGNAVFLCAGSLSPKNALWEVSENSVHPMYGGTKMKVEDAVAASGVKKVYIMLGINSLSNGVDDCINDITKLINNILEKSPNVRILVQSVTPMTKTSPIITQKLNNYVINEYNQRLYELCCSNRWYYLNVAEAFRDSEGNLIDSYCSDGAAMGIHFTFEADRVWADYLKTHVPEGLK